MILDSCSSNKMLLSPDIPFPWFISFITVASCPALRSSQIIHSNLTLPSRCRIDKCQRCPAVGNNIPQAPALLQNAITASKLDLIWALTSSTSSWGKVFTCMPKGIVWFIKSYYGLKGEKTLRSNVCPSVQMDVSVLVLLLFVNCLCVCLHVHVCVTCRRCKCADIVHKANGCNWGCAQSWIMVCLLR